MTENQTLFLHLSSLTPEDEVNVTCRCTSLDGTFLLRLNVTVEEEAITSISSEELIPYVVIGVILFMVPSGAILGLICRNTCNGRQQEATTGRPDVEPGDIEPYSTFTQRESSSSVPLQHVKTTGKEPYVAPVCGSTTKASIAFVQCTIITKRNSGSQCQLVYLQGKDFNTSCDSRFRLMTQNPTVVLHLSSLTPEDEVNVTCQCTSLDGKFLLRLNVTVEEEAITSISSEELIPNVVIGVILIMVTSGAILGLICRNTCNGRQQEATSGRPDVVLSTKTFVSYQLIQ
ncbi:uncharacterized protein LOC132996995 [Limanda limanda]|uniref:uncharacterized protein LOC132996995 n=1 Tax=Limanda limanda TaxID=27771 RepID=UPI0029C634F9|nr:uncharacterized protein LOC132996995 [Limanda limanda]